MAPVLGAIADSGGYRKRFLVYSRNCRCRDHGIGLAWSPEGGWPAALALYLLASVGYYSANVFLRLIARGRKQSAEHYRLVSSLGFSLGYFGGASLLALHVWMLSNPAGVRLSIRRTRLSALHSCLSVSGGCCS